ncbi:MAG: hypothetical protein ACI9C1_003812, partial [Candidatus Aldehydirespiratoraceae bacterium]
MPERDRARRQRGLIAVIILLVGLLIGLAAAALLNDDDDAVTVTTAPATYPTATPTAPASYPTATPTTTAEYPVATAPVADAVSGDVLGFALGSNAETVISALNAIYGAPDLDSGWNQGCPLDAGPEDHDRLLTYGNFRLRLDRWDQPEQLAGWSFQNHQSEPAPANGPRPEEIALHPGVDWSLTGSAVATLLGVEMNPVEDFGVTFINTGEGDY